LKIKDIINELNVENGSNYKLSIFKKYSGNDLFKRVLKMTYDNVVYNYGITLKNVPEYAPESGRPISLNTALDELLKLSSREITGNAAISFLHSLLCNLSADDAEVLEKIIKRDLRINAGKTLINKVHKNLITDPCYMRCDVYSSKKI
jgi:hypothetical protein